MIVKLNDVDLVLYSVKSFTDKESGEEIKYNVYTFRDSFGETLEANSKSDFSHLEREKVDVDLDIDKFGNKWQVKLSNVYRAGDSDDSVDDSDDV